jgi:hypothetical protein
LNAPDVNKNRIKVLDSLSKFIESSTKKDQFSWNKRIRITAYNYTGCSEQMRPSFGVTKMQEIYQ